MDILKKIVGGHVRELRKKLGYTTIDAWAEALEVHPNSVGELERGTNWLSPEMLEKMVNKTELPPSAFFPGGDRTTPTRDSFLAGIITRIPRLHDDQLRALFNIVDGFDRDNAETKVPEQLSRKKN